MTLGGHVDRGLSLAALYDTGVLERLRLEVRMRLIADVTQSLSWLHANPRLMAAHPHLVIAPSTIVIGLDGVARVDVRAAKKQDSERGALETDYFAPEVLSHDPAADLRADVFSIGVLAWEALAGKRISAPDVWDGELEAIEGPSGDEDLPAALGGRSEREPLRRKPAPRSEPKPGSQARLRGAPPLTLADDCDWAMPFAELALQAMSPSPADRPSDCRSLVAELELIAARLATTQEIAEVVQGISSVDTLCVPEPTLPDADAMCQSDTGERLAFMDREVCSDVSGQSCAQRQVAAPRRVEPAPAARPPSVKPGAPAPAPPADVSRTVRRLHEISAGSARRVWFIAGLLSLAVLGLLAGYIASILAVR